MDRIELDFGALGRNEHRLYRMHRNGGMVAAMYSETTEDQVIEGQAVGFNKPIPIDGVLLYLKNYALGKSFDPDGPIVGFWIDHNKASEVATTDDALQLVIDEKGVQFRLDLAKAKNGKLLAHLCKSGNREDISVGLDLIDYEDRVMEGQDVRIVHKARLKEISLVKSGAAGDEGFAAVVDASITPKPVAGKRSATFNTTYALHKVSRGIREMKAALGRIPDSEVSRRSMTNDQLNHWQTAETERLQALARSRW